MDWNRAKNVIIIILCIMNVFLVVNISYLYIRNEAAALDTAAELRDYLEERGISIDAEMVPRENLKREVLILERSSAAEEYFSRALLGDTPDFTAADGAYTAGDYGINIRLGGYFNARISSLLTPEDAALLLTSTVPGDITHGTDGGVFITYSFLGYPVYNCTAGISESEGGLVVFGRVPTGEIFRTNAGSERDAAGLLIGVAQRLLNYGVSEITAINPGWIAGSVSGVGTRLIPVYSVTTNAGEYYINTVDGTLVSVE